MKQMLAIVLAIGLSTAAGQEGNLQPYLEYSFPGADIQAATEEISGRIEAAGLMILGRYSPAGDPGKVVIAVTGDDLLAAVASGSPTAGFAAALRVAITWQDSQLVVSSQNPPYWANAYFQSDYPAVAGLIEAFAQSLDQALSSDPSGAVTPFGSEQGLDVGDLRHYHYMFGMPYFEDLVKLATFPSFEEAAATIEKNLATSEVASKVFEVQAPGKAVRLYGIALGGERGEGRFLPIIDISHRTHTAFLPYGLLVMDGEVVMLHGRFRIALSYPDLTMGTFTKIMSTPGDIKKMMQALTE